MSRVTIKRIGLNSFGVFVGGKKRVVSQGKINATRQANIIRKKQGKRTIVKL